MASLIHIHLQSVNVSSIGEGGMRSHHLSAERTQAFIPSPISRIYSRLQHSEDQSKNRSGLNNRPSSSTDLEKVLLIMHRHAEGHRHVCRGRHPYSHQDRRPRSEGGSTILSLLPKTREGPFFFFKGSVNKLKPLTLM